MAPSLIPEIIEGIADAKDVEPAELNLSLHDYIDTDAIEQLASHETASWTLSFELPNHNVTVTSDGLILVDGSQKALWA